MNFPSGRRRLVCGGLAAITLALATSSAWAQDGIHAFCEAAAVTFNSGDYDGALAQLDSAIAASPDSVMLYSARGVMLERLRYFTDAIADFTEGFRRTTDNELKSHFLMNRGGAKMRIRDFGGAYADATAALAIDSTNLNALNNAATAASEVGRPEEAFVFLERIIAVDSAHVPAYVNLGFAYQEAGRHAEALPYFDRAVALAPDEPLSYNNRGFSKLELGDAAAALVDIDRSLELDPSNSYAYKNRALALVAQGRIGEACADLTRATDLGYREQYGTQVEALQRMHCE